MSIAIRLALVAALARVATEASAQTPEIARPASTGTVVAVNVALGALTAGTWSAARGKSFWNGFARGAAGGAVVYAGKRIITERNPFAWWVGREVSALGSSEVVNAAKGFRVLQTAVLPVGPLRIHVDRLARRKIVPRLDLASSISAIVIASHDRARFAFRESLATGAIVFVVPEKSQTIGMQTAGILSLSELLPDGNFPPLTSKRSVISHEMIHAAQYDFAFTVWSDAAQESIGARIPFAARMSRYVDVNLILPLQFGLNSIIDYTDRPWEQEAANLVRD